MLYLINQENVVIEKDSCIEEHQGKYIVPNKNVEYTKIGIVLIELTDDKIKIGSRIINGKIQAETIISKAKFLKRLTFEELNALTNYEKTIPETDEEYTQKCMAMKTLWNLFDKFIEVDLGDAEWVADFLQIVVWTGLISLERAIEVTTP